MVTLRPRQNSVKESSGKVATIANKKSPATAAKPKMASKKTKSATGFKVSQTSTASSLKGAKDPEGILNEYLLTRIMAEDHKANHPDDIQQLHTLIRQKAPTLIPELQGTTTLAYGGFDYVTKSGCTGRWSRLSIMVNKSGLSLTVCGYKDGKYLLEHYYAKNSKKYFGKTLSIGKSCIRFAKLEDLNLDHIGEVLEEAASADINAVFA